MAAYFFLIFKCLQEKYLCVSGTKYLPIQLSGVKVICLFFSNKTHVFRATFTASPRPKAKLSSLQKSTYTTGNLNRFIPHITFVSCYVLTEPEPKHYSGNILRGKECFSI